VKESDLSCHLENVFYTEMVECVKYIRNRAARGISMPHNDERSDTLVPYALPNPHEFVIEKLNFEII